MSNKDEILDAMRDDPSKGEVTLDDGKLRVSWSEEPDYDTNLLDESGPGSWSGSLAYGDGRDYSRPDDFDGNAERLDRYNPGVCQGDYIGLWWQPPEDVKRGTPEFDGLRRTILDILTYGYVGMVVTAERDIPCDCCDKCGAMTGTESDTAALWGIEWSSDDDYRVEVLSDLLDELDESIRIAGVQS